jgi:hypothetical protein
LRGQANSGAQTSCKPPPENFRRTFWSSTAHQGATAARGGEPEKIAKKERYYAGQKVTLNRQQHKSKQVFTPFFLTGLKGTRKKSPEEQKMISRALRKGVKRKGYSKSC